MSIQISGGPSGITVETDPTALKLTGGALSGELSLPQVGNLLNENLVVDSYNDTGAGTHYYHTFTPFDGKFNLATNGGGLTFPNGTTQTTAGLPLTGGTLTGKVNTLAPTSTDAGLNIGSIDSNAILTNSVAGDVWMGRFQLTYKNYQGNVVYGAGTNVANVFGANQIIDSSSSSPALRVTQRGTGNSFLVEDATTPDTSALVVDASGNVGVGVATGYTATQKVEVVGNVKADGFVNGSGPVFKVNGTQTHSGGSDTHELLLSVNGSTYRVGMRFVSTP